MLKNKKDQKSSNFFELRNAYFTISGLSRQKSFF